METKQKLLLLFISMGGEIDPVRIMKGMFLLAENARERWLSDDSYYEFEPYYYGPCSFEIYSDLRELKAKGLIMGNRVVGESWERYSVTEKGKEFAREVEKELTPDLVRYIKKICDFVSSLTFRQLLTVIYRFYPEYATRSVFKL